MTKYVDFTVFAVTNKTGMAAVIVCLRTHFLICVLKYDLAELRLFMSTILHVDDYGVTNCLLNTGKIA